MTPEQQKKKAYYLANKERINAKNRAWYAENKEKRNASQKAYREANKEKIAAQNKRYTATEDAREKRRKRDRDRYDPIKQKAKNTAFREANPEYHKEWKQHNSYKNAAYTANRRAAQLQQTPSWADQVAISFVYHAADVIHKVYGGVKPHVDHIVPLQGDNVSGLHVENNLQLLSAKDNMSKSNTWIP